MSAKVTITDTTVSVPSTRKLVERLQANRQKLVESCQVLSKEGSIIRVEKLSLRTEFRNRLVSPKNVRLPSAVT